MGTEATTCFSASLSLRDDQGDVAAAQGLRDSVCPPRFLLWTQDHIPADIRSPSEDERNESCPILTLLSPSHPPSFAALLKEEQIYSRLNSQAWKLDINRLKPVAERAKKVCSSFVQSSLRRSCLQLDAWNNGIV